MSGPPKLARAGEILACYALGSAVGGLFSWLNLPLPWMIGPLLSTAFLGLAIRPVAIPIKTRPVGQIIVAAHVGLYFNEQALGAIYDHASAILAVAFATALIGLFLSILLKRLSGTDTVTAVLASVPGGPVEMGLLAKQYGGDPGPVIFAQTLRIAAIVILVPSSLYFLLDATRGRPGEIALTHDPLGMAILALGAVTTALVFRLCRINNPFFLGPLAFSCAATAAGLPLSPYPHVFVSAAQVLLGTWLGSTFKRSLFTNAGRLVLSTTLTSVLLVALCTAFAASLAATSAVPWETLVLGAAPGSVTEMALTARFLHEDVALITAFHLTRIFLIIPNIPWILALLHGRSVLGSRKENP